MNRYDGLKPKLHPVAQASPSFSKPHNPETFSAQSSLGYPIIRPFLHNPAVAFSARVRKLCDLLNFSVLVGT